MNRFENKKQAKNDKTTAGAASGDSYERTRERRIDEKIDRDLQDSFPASDPPGWTLGV